MWDWLKKLIGRSLTETEPRADIHLKANTEAALSRALRKLSPGQEGWITFAEAGRLFSAEDDNPLSETAKLLMIELTLVSGIVRIASLPCANAPLTYA